LPPQSPTSSPEQSPTKQSVLSRRRLLQLGAGAALLGAGFYFGIIPWRQTRTIKLSRPLMGTIVNVIVVTDHEDNAHTAIDTAFVKMGALADELSTYDENSPISMLNREGILRNAPQSLLDVFTRSRRLSEVTDGAFDPTVMPLLHLYQSYRETATLPPQSMIDKALKLVDYRKIVVENQTTIRYTLPGMQVTLDGLAKGYIVDAGVGAMEAAGLTDFYLEAGGDLMVRGHRQDGTDWRIGIRNPRSDNLTQMKSIGLSDKAIATSGDYLRYFSDDKTVHHIIDPRSGFSPIELASSSIVAPSVVQADGMATATMVMGAAKSLELIGSLPDCEGYFIDKSMNTHHTEGFFT
jgi:thiamine biosynthesis lipoprotein